MFSVFRICRHHINYIRNEPYKIYNQTRPAGHAKWQNIKGTKQATDLAKGKLVSRYVQLVRKAVVTGGMQTDPRLNTKLGDVLSEANKLNVPKATLERAITRAVNLKIISLNIEIQGPGGSSIIARCETENIPNLRRDVKKAIKKFDSNIMPDDTLINMFKSQGFIRTALITSDGRDICEEFAEEAAIMANAQEVYQETIGENDENLNSAWVFLVDAETLNPCKGELEKLKFKILSCDLDLVPYREIKFGEDVCEKVVELQKALRELDQVVDVYTNVTIK